MLIRHIIDAIEQVAPLPIQEEWDNSGLQVGNAAAECTGVMLCVDCTPAVVDEALAEGCNLIVSHHPVIFKGLKRLTGSTPAEVTVMNAIAAGVSIYSSHTALDSAAAGVSRRMARMLGLEDIEVLDPRMADALKLTVYVPEKSADSLRLALFDAGAGHIGNYDSCSYNTAGRGTFRALDGASPAVGERYAYHTEAETRIEVVLPGWCRHAVEEALRATHPYEEPAYEFIPVETGMRTTGLGCVGNLPAPMSARDIAMLTKRTFGCEGVRVSRLDDGDGDAPLLRRVALCGGAGGSLIGAAVRSRAQIYITADVRYHDFVDWSSRLTLVDIGHFDSEQCARDIFYQIITEKFPTFAVKIAKNEKNPIQFL